MKRVAIYPGTFDPITHGHFDVIQRASSLFDQLVVAVAQSAPKAPLFQLTERIEMVATVTQSMPNVTVNGFDHLLIDFAREHQASAIVRGLRTSADFDYELPLARMNRQLEPRLETVFLIPSSEFAFISASLVKEVARFGGDVQQWVDDSVRAALLAKLEQ